MLTQRATSDRSWWVAVQSDLQQRLPDIVEMMPPSDSLASPIKMIDELFSAAERTDAWRVLADILLTHTRALARDDKILAWLGSRIGVELSALRQPVPLDVENPYPGLARFDHTRANVYRAPFAVPSPRELVNQLGRFFAVIGPPGSGKSSLIAAYILPALGQEIWVQEVNCLKLSVVSPASDLLGLLNAPANGSLAEAATRILATQGRARLLLVLDQFETRLADCEDAAHRQLLDAITAAARSSASIDILLTLHDHVDQRTEAHAEFATLRGSANLRITQVSPELLRASIRAPAASVGVDTDDALVEKLVAEVREQPSMLPFLQITLSRNFEQARVRAAQSDGAFRMTLGTDQKAPIRGAIAVETAAIDQLDGAAEWLPRIFAAVVDYVPPPATRANSSGTRIRRRAPIAKLGDSSVVRKLLDQRLLTQSDGFLELAHDVLLTSWDFLVKWTTANRQTLQLLTQLRMRCWRWRDEQEAASQLLVGAELRRIVELPDWAGFGIGPGEAQFIAASRSRLRKRRIRIAIPSLMGLGLVIVMGIQVIKARIEAAERAATERERKLSELQEDKRKQARDAVRASANDARRALRFGLPMEAVGLAASTARLVPDNDPEADRTARQVLLDVLLDVAPHETLYPSGNMKKIPRVAGLALAPDGRRLAYGTQRDLRILTLDDRSTRVVRKLPSPPESIEWSQDGRSLLVKLDGAEVLLLRPDTGGDDVLPVRNAKVARFATPGADEVITIGDCDGPQPSLGQQRCFELWDTGTQRAVDREGMVPASDARAADGGRHFLFVHEDALYVWQRDGKVRQISEAPAPANLLELQVSADDRWALLRSAGSGLFLQDLRASPGNESPLRTLQSRQFPLRDECFTATFSADAAWVYAGFRSGAVIGWRVDKPEIPILLTRHDGMVSRIVAAKMTQSVFSASHDGTVHQIVNDERPFVRTHRGHHGSIIDLVVAPDDAFFITQSSGHSTAAVYGRDDRSIRKWSLAATSMPVLMNPTGRMVARSLAISPTGHEIAVATFDDRVQRWDLATREFSTAIPVHANHLRYSADGRVLYAMTNDGRLFTVGPAAKQIVDLSRLLRGFRLFVLDFRVESNEIEVVLNDGTWIRGLKPDTVTLDDPGVRLRRVADSYDGRMYELSFAQILPACDATLWHLATGSYLYDASGHLRKVGANSQLSGDCRKLFEDQHLRLVIRDERPAVPDRQFISLDLPVHDRINTFAVNMHGDLVVASTGGEIYVWTLDRDKLRKIAEAL